MNGLTVVHFDGVLARTSSEYGSVPYSDGVSIYRSLALDASTVITFECAEASRVEQFCALLRISPTWLLSTPGESGEAYVDAVMGFAGKQRTKVGLLLTARSNDAVVMSSRGVPATIYVKPMLVTAMLPRQSAWAAVYDPLRDSAWAYADVDALNSAEDIEPQIEEEL